MRQQTFNYNTAPKCVRKFIDESDVVQKDWVVRIVGTVAPMIAKNSGKLTGSKMVIFKIYFKDPNYELAAQYGVSTNETMQELAIGRKLNGQYDFPFQ